MTKEDQLVQKVASALVMSFDLDKWCHLQRLITVGQLAPYLAHEANQPLTAICNYSGGLTMALMNTQPPFDQVTDSVSKIMSEAFRASAMLKRLRDSSTHQPFQSATIEVNTLVRQTLDAIKDYLVAERTAVQIVLGSQVPSISADVRRIEQVLINLIKNAVEAMSEMPAQERYIVVSTRRCESHIEISIKDAGPPLAQEQLSKMLQPYDSKKPFGMGIGLWVSNRIVEQHGGELELRQVEPQGLEAVVRLPSANSQLASAT